MQRDKILLRLSESQASALAAYVAKMKESDETYEFNRDHAAILMKGIGRKDLAKAGLARGRPKKVASE